MKRLFLISFCVVLYYGCRFNKEDCLVGTWHRMEDGLHGMNVEVSKDYRGIYNGKITRLADDAHLLPFEMGELKWKKIKQKSEGKFEFNDLHKYVLGSDTRYQSKFVESELTCKNDTIRTSLITPRDEIVGNYQVWVREK